MFNCHVRRLSRKRAVLLVIGSMLFLSGISAGKTLDPNGFGYPAPKLISAEKLDLWSTYYYVHEAQYDTAGIVLADVKGNPTGAKLASCDWCDSAVEGTVRTTDKDGKKITLNYATVSAVQQNDCNETCPKYRKFAIKKVGYTLWAPAVGEFGDGVAGYQLVPFRTIAVDKTVIPIGSLVFIPKAVGVEITLPNGSRSKHDGYFFAADVGGGIKGNHIDVFFGLRTKNPFDFVLSKPEATFDAFVLEDPMVQNALANQHKN